MFDKAVICTDLTADSDRLVGCAGALRVLGVREAVLTHVVDVFSGGAAALPGRGAAEDTFERQLAMLEDSGFDVHVEAPMGHPAFSLEEVRRRHAASLIVVGSHGKNVFRGPFSGSISSDLVQLSESPVFVANLNEGDDAASSALVCARVLGRVLFCTDFSDSAEQAFVELRALARQGAREFVLLHVQDRDRVSRAPRDLLPEYDRRDAVRLAHMRTELLDAGAESVEIRIIYGVPGPEIAERAASGEFTLVVMGSRGRGSTRDAFLGGVSDQAVREAQTPLLLVPAREPLPATI